MIEKFSPTLSRASVLKKEPISLLSPFQLRPQGSLDCDRYPRSAGLPEANRGLSNLPGVIPEPLICMFCRRTCEVPDTMHRKSNCFCEDANPDHLEVVILYRLGYGLHTIIGDGLTKSNSKIRSGYIQKRFIYFQR